jgi:hypothetical protein
LVTLELKVLREQLAFLDRKDQTVLVDLLGQQDLRVVLGLLEILDSQDR